MKSLDTPIGITPTLTLPRQRGRGIPGLPDENELDLTFEFFFLHGSLNFSLQVRYRTRARSRPVEVLKRE